VAQGLKCIIPGGISTKVLTAAEHRGRDLRPQVDALAAGSQVGSGGMIVIAEGTCMVRLLQVMLRFYHHESCGQCTPCREGMGWMQRIIDRIVAGRWPARRHRCADTASPMRTTARRSAVSGDAAGYAAVGIIEPLPRRVRVLHRTQHSMLGGRLEVTTAGVVGRLEAASA
jgi:NADH-quinone oxidoreductase subunit F